MNILWYGHPDYVCGCNTIKSLGFDPRSKLNGYINVHRYVNLGRNGVIKSRMIGSSFGIDELYRERDKQYIALCEEVVETANKYDVFVVSQFNFIHPEFLKKITTYKVFGMVDDPISTYDRGLVYSHFFDSCFYISQGYLSGVTMSELLSRFQISDAFHLPLTTINLPRRILSINDMDNRSLDIVYIGAAYGKKVDTLLQMKRRFKDKLQVYGRWPFKGYYGYVRPVWGSKLFPHKVEAVSDQEKWEIYLKSKIGFNLHYTGVGNEDGNMRTYEVLATGALLLQNESSTPLEKRLFKGNSEAVYYKSYDDAMDKIDYFLKNSAERNEIAINGHVKFQKLYSHDNNLEKFFTWINKNKEQKK